MGKKLTKKEEKELKEIVAKFTPQEKKIYELVMNTFPATNPFYAVDVAWQEGIKFQFHPN